MPELKNLDQVANFKVLPQRKFFSAEHQEILDGVTTDIYFVRTYEILEKLNKASTPVVAEIFARKGGILAGVEEVKNLLQDKNVAVWSLPEGAEFAPKEVVMRISGPYNQFGLYETVLLGMLASSSGWATAAKIAKEACGDKPMFCFGARHVHPAVAPVMERAALVGGADGASCILAAKLYGIEPSGTVPHAIFLIVGDTLEVAKAYDCYMPKDARRLMLVDTFRDEVEETLYLAENLRDKLEGIRLDTPSERGGVTPDLVKELRYRLDMAGFKHIKLFVSGGLYPEKIQALKEAGADSFGVTVSYLLHHQSI